MIEIRRVGGSTAGLDGYTLKHNKYNSIDEAREEIYYRMARHQTFDIYKDGGPIRHWR